VGHGEGAGEEEREERVLCVCVCANVSKVVQLKKLMGDKSSFLFGAI